MLADVCNQVRSAHFQRCAFFHNLGHDVRFDNIHTLSSDGCLVAFTAALVYPPAWANANETSVMDHTLTRYSSSSLPVLPDSSFLLCALATSVSFALIASGVWPVVYFSLSVPGIPLGTPSGLSGSRLRSWR